MARVLAVGTLGVVTGVQPVRAGDLVLNCYVFEAGIGASTPFTRRIELDTKAGTVAIADDRNHTGFKALGAYGTVVTADNDSLVFDFTSARSSGRTTIDRKAGTLYFTDGRIVTRGTCTHATL